MVDVDQAVVEAVAEVQAWGVEVSRTVVRLGHWAAVLLAWDREWPSTEESRRVVLERIAFQVDRLHDVLTDGAIPSVVLGGAVRRAWEVTP